MQKILTFVSSLLIIAGLTLLYINYTNQIAIIFGALLVCLGILVAIITTLIYCCTHKDIQEEVDINNPVYPVARVVDPAIEPEPTRIVMGIAL